jgi:hypothetical protein
VELGQFFSEYFGFPYQFSFHRLLHTISQTVADVRNGLSLTPHQETELNWTKVWTEQVDLEAMLKVRIRKVLDLILVRHTGYPDRFFNGFPRCFDINARIANSGGWSPNWVHSAPRPFTVLLCLPRAIVRMENYSVEWRLAGEAEVLEKTCPSATLSTTNSTWPDPGSNPGRRGGKPATNRLSYGAS